MPRKALSLSALVLWLVACDSGPTAPDPAVDAQLSVESGLTLVPVPSPELPGPPFYARTAEPPEPIFMVDGWAVFQFYRDPGCIPADFNLLLFFDPPRAFGCTSLVEGFALFRGGGPSGSIPEVVLSQGAGPVPYWFVPADAAEEAIDDGVLTIGELAELPGRLVGYASQFNEMQHPSGPPVIGSGGHRNPMLSQSARGTLEDGRQFEYHLTEFGTKVSAIRLRFH